MKYIIIFFSIVYINQSAIAQCTINSANIFSYKYAGKNYAIVKEKKTWVQAAQCAVALGGKLIEINSKLENDTLFYYKNLAGINNSNTVAPDGGGASYIWIGGNDITAEGKWVWDGINSGSGVQFWQGTASGSTVGGLYNNWGNEPDNWNGQDGLAFAITNWPLGIAGEWNDVKETNQLYFVIEYDNASAIKEGSINNFKLYPNPLTASQNLSIIVSKNIESGNIIITNNLGQIVLQKSLNNITTNDGIIISDIQLSAGIYYLSLETGYLISTEKLIITK